MYRFLIENIIKPYATCVTCVYDMIFAYRQSVNILCLLMVSTYVCWIRQVFVVRTLVHHVRMASHIG